MVAPRTFSQQLMESVWTVNSSSEMTAVYDRIMEALPECIRERSASLAKLDTACLELCSLLDLCICHFMNRLLSIVGDGVDGDIVPRKKSVKLQIERFPRAIPMVREEAVSDDIVLCVKRLCMSHSPRHEVQQLLGGESVSGSLPFSGAGWIDCLLNKNAIRQLRFTVPSPPQWPLACG